MAYNANKKARLKDVKALAQVVKGLSNRIGDLEADMQALSTALLTLTNSVIANITKESFDDLGADLSMLSNALFKLTNSVITNIEKGEGT